MEAVVVVAAVELDGGEQRLSVAVEYDGAEVVGGG